MRASIADHGRHPRSIASNCHNRLKVHSLSSFHHLFHRNYYSHLSMASTIVNAQISPHANGWVYSRDPFENRPDRYHYYAYQHFDGPTWFGASWGGLGFPGNGPGGWMHQGGITAVRRRRQLPYPDGMASGLLDELRPDLRHQLANVPPVTSAGASGQ